MTDKPQDRKRIFLLSGISNYGAIIVSIVVSLISVPIGLNYFGSVRYGIWLVIASVLAYLRITDFGIGLSTLTFISQTSEPSHHRIILRRSIGLLAVISVASIAVTIILTSLFPEWVTILGKIPLNLWEETSSALFTIVILTLLQLPMTIFLSAFSGLQQVHWNRIYEVFHSIVNLGALISTVLVGGNLITLAVLKGLGGLIVGIAAGIHLFLSHPQVCPQFNERVKDAPPINLLFTSGIRFLFLQIGVLIIWNTDNIVISYYLGPEKVTPYAITFKLFQMGLTMVTASIIGLWPMYGRTFGQGDWHWIQRTYNRSTFLQIIPGGLVWIGGIIFSQLIINMWAGPLAYGGLLVVFALGGYVYISSFGGVNHSLINGLNPTNIVVIFGIIEATLNLVISLILVKPFGIGGVALGTFIASLAVNTWFPPLYIRYRTSRKVNLEIKPILTHAVIVISCVVLSLILVLYSHEGWMRFVGGITIIMGYLVLSWRVVPNTIQNLTKDTLIKLYARIRAKKAVIS